METLVVCSAPLKTVHFILRLRVTSKDRDMQFVQKGALNIPAISEF